MIHVSLKDAVIAHDIKIFFLSFFNLYANVFTVLCDVHIPNRLQVI